ncbi:MAG: ABC transporter substrate-binding protein [Chloroflexota bacterium]|nr:ABC transporter substrate-binding protein [Chloroflexota bacterium]
MKTWWMLLVIPLMLGACLVKRPATPVKVGLLAPFEGERREQGYHLLPALGAATQEEVRGRQVEWVILDTRGDPETAVQRAREVVVDPAVVAVVGPLLPDEVEAVTPLMEEAGVAWWPLAPSGQQGLRRWLGTVVDEVENMRAWGAWAWPAIRRSDTIVYWDPQVLDDPEPLVTDSDERLWPQDWLVWEAVHHLFDALEEADTFSRSAVRRAATPLDLPPPVQYRSQEGAYPGIPISE